MTPSRATRSISICGSPISNQRRRLAISLFQARGSNGTGRISLSQDPAVSLQYAGELIAAFVQRAGGRVTGKISIGTVPQGLQPVYVHRQSRPLSTILAELLRASNNYVHG